MALIYDRRTIEMFDLLFVYFIFSLVMTRGGLPSGLR